MSDDNKKDSKAWSRRRFLQWTGAAAGITAAGALTVPLAKEWLLKGAHPELPAKLKIPIDYTKAKAIPTICFGCTTHCGVIGWVQDGIVRKIEGNPLEPNARGKCCAKAQGMISYTYYPERLLYPLKRTGPRGSGQWKRITWEEALNEIASKMRKLREDGHPEQFIFHYGRDKTKGFSKKFTNAFGTPNRLNRRSICSSNRRVPLMSFYGRDFEWETQDFENTKYIINFGANPMEAHQGGFYMMQRIQQARVDGGAKMVTFEVRPSATASVSDEYYPIFPGTDGIVAAAMANTIIDEKLYDQKFWDKWANCSLSEVKKTIASFTPEEAAKHSGIPAKDIRRIAHDFAKAAPKCCTLSNRGSAKHYNGYQSDRCIRLLDVLVGNVGKEGGFCLSSLRSWKGFYGQEGLPRIAQPGPKPPKPKPWLPGTPLFATLSKEVQERVKQFPKKWQNKYYGELATPSEYPLSWHWYSMRVGQLVYPYIKEKRHKVGVYMSYTLGASYGYPEAKVAREVLKDESLIPFHVAIDISYSEQASLADIILPEATSLERWDAHSTNAYNLIPYTGLRQPLAKPLGETRPLQTILRDLAHKIGGGMEKHFDFKEVEDYYKAWYKEVPLSWEELKRRGVWYDPSRPKDYELYNRPLTKDELKDSKTDPKTGLITVQKGSKTKTIGIMQDGKAVRGFPTPTRKIQVFDPIFQTAAKVVGIPLTDPLASPLPTYFTVPGHDKLQSNEFVFTTFKWNVHTQGRSGHLKYQSEIVHANPLFMAPETAKNLGLKDNDWVEVTIRRPDGRTYKAGEKPPVGSFKNRVRVQAGMHPKVVAASHHTGHWEHGAVGKASKSFSKASKPGNQTDLPQLKDKDLPEKIWWSKAAGGVGGGVHINDAMPINPAPLVGGQNWFDNICTIKKLS